MVIYCSYILSVGYIDASSKNIEAYLILSFDSFAIQIVDSMILILGFGSTAHQYALRFGIKIITNTLLETAMC